VLEVARQSSSSYKNKIKKLQLSFTGGLSYQRRHINLPMYFTALWLPLVGHWFWLNQPLLQWCGVMQKNLHFLVRNQCYLTSELKSHPDDLTCARNLPLPSTWTSPNRTVECSF